jgi:hypothetical protein
MAISRDAATGTPSKWAAKIEKNNRKKAKEVKEKKTRLKHPPIKKALCGNRRPSNDCLPYENS